MKGGTSTDYDTYEITADPNSALYKDALAIAIATGRGQSNIDYDKVWYSDLSAHLYPQDVPNTKVPEIGDIPKPEDFVEKIPDVPEIGNIIPSVEEFDSVESVSSGVFDLADSTLNNLTIPAVASVPKLPTVER